MERKRWGEQAGAGRMAVAAVAALVLFLVGPDAQCAEKTSARPVIQVALLLDTSNSMDGLINQAKTQLWKVVNEFAKARKDGRTPELQVALYEYGNNSLSAGEGYIRMVSSLTTDLDRISEELFALKTNGGSEYCGAVIQKAGRELSWSAQAADYRAVFIAGNEPFTQGTVDFREACRAAIGKGIIVNTIFCGNYEEGAQTGWKDGAALADGKYLNIDQDTQAVRIDAPQDRELSRLGSELNTTYVPYGAGGGAGKARQEAQDRNALASGAAVVAERTAAKATVQYTNTSWDLVDAVREGKVSVDKLRDEELPVEMKGMNGKQREEYVRSRLTEREKIQARISRLNEERRRYIADEMKKRAGSGTNTLDAALIETVRSQVVKKGFAI